MATTLAAVGLIGGGLSAFNQYQQGKTAEQIAEQNAHIAENEADLIKQGAKLDEFRKRKQLKAFVGTQTASFAKSGVELTGSPLDVMQDTIANAELEIAIGRFNSEMASRGKRSEAERIRFAGRATRTAAQITAASTLLATAGDFGSKFAVPKKTKIGE